MFLIRNFFRRRQVRRLSKARGDLPARLIQRRARRERIQEEKQRIISDLFRSWSLGEIKQPLQSEVDEIYYRKTGISWTRLLEIKRKYWHENI